MPDNKKICNLDDCSATKKTKENGQCEVVGQSAIERKTVESRKKDEKPQKIDKWQLMRIAEDQDCEAFEAADFEQTNVSSERQYRDFYDDVKQPSDYIKEDW